MRRCERARRSTRRLHESWPPSTSAGGTCIVTADHGNAEQMLTEAGLPHTAHTTNLVPVVVVPAGGAQAFGIQGLHSGRLADVAPTVLDCSGCRSRRS